MDQIAIGKFIAECRKEKHLTQAQLAERLGVTDRAVSKWETGRSMPDVSIMLDLCEQIDISVNDLLNARRINMENYREIAEKTLLEMREREEHASRSMLTLEWVIAFIATFAMLGFIMLAAFVEMPEWLVGVLVGTGIFIFAVGMYFGLKIETEAGYYACPNCDERYVPTFWNVLWAPHFGRTRWMRCPHCGKRGYHKKVLTKEK